MGALQGKNCAIRILSYFVAICGHLGNAGYSSNAVYSIGYTYLHTVTTKFVLTNIYMIGTITDVGQEWYTDRLNQSHLYSGVRRIAT